MSPKRRACIYESMPSLTEFRLTDATALLSRTPATLDALLREMPDVWVRRYEGQDTWSAFDIVGHLVSGERNDWMPRLRILLESGEARAFDPFDRFAQTRESQGKSLEQLLDEFARLRKENLAALRTLDLQPEDLKQKGKHPSLGVVTLSQLLHRHGYQVEEVSYLAHRTPGRGRALLAGAVRSVLPAHLAENTLLVAATTT